MLRAVVTVVVLSELLLCTCGFGQNTDTAYTRGAAAGRLAATGKGGDAFGWTLGASILSGCCIGGLLPYPVSMPLIGMSYPCLAGGAGGALTGVIISGQGASVPAEMIANKSETYSLGFIEGYNEVVKKKRQDQALIGTAVGAGFATAIGIIIILMGTSLTQ
jgi:hypothetical protein